MKFKKGDIIICDNNHGEWCSSAMLEIGKTYIVDSINKPNNSLYLKLDNTLPYPYDENKFISLEEYRRIKILKIKNKIKNYEN